MATGVPKKKRSAVWSGFWTSNEPAVCINYPGKRSAREILATLPGEVTPFMIRTGAIRSDLPKRLYFADNVPILASLLRDSSVAGKVRLVYIDPPFATRTVFHSRQLQHAYDDVLTGGEYLEFLRERLLFLKELLAPDGSIYVHLDGKMIFHVKIIMDEIFGASNFRNCITRKKCNPKNYTRKQYGNVADYVLFYTKTANYVWNKPLEAWTQERAREYQYVDHATGRRFMKVPIHAPGVRNGETGRPWRGVLPPPGKHWQFPPSVLDEMDSRGEIYWSPSGNPRRKIFLDASLGVSVQDIWLDFKDAHNQNIQVSGYPTEKNPELLARIIEASSNPGDLVLDCFSGSGTTLAVADRLGRHWIGIDNSTEAIKTTVGRFEHGLEPMGDFVSQRGDGNASEEGNQMATLFSLGEPGTRTRQAAFAAAETEGWFAEKPHRAIRDYILFVDTSLRDSAESFVSTYRLSPYTPSPDIPLIL